MKFYLALWFAKIINVIINIVDKSRGSNFSGQKAMKIDPQMVAHFKGIDYSKVLFITGTNGKSTTNNLVNHIFRTNGRKVVSNLEGANLIYGVATALSKASSLTGRIKADYIIFETDERYLPLIYKQLPAANIMITNLQKDQVQRNGDPDFIYRKVFDGLPSGIRFFLNNEEPRTRSFDIKSDHIVTYGVARHEESFTKGETFPTMACPRCRHKIVFDYYNNDGVGKFHCTHCGLAADATADYTITDVNFAERKFKLGDVGFTMPYDTPYMCYNYAGALAVAKELGGIEPADAAKAFGSFKNVGGRFEILKYKDKTIKYMRIKQENPETLQTCINVMAADKERKMVCLGLCPLIDMIPHYTNSFYAFDCDLSGLVKSDVERYFCFSEAVCFDTANRLIYEGVDRSQISIAETEDVETIFKEIEEAETKNIYLITWLHTFEHMKKYIDKEGK
ncbi:MurT ligase domain-containing protein [Ihubacter sp. rT4E-8]|uniref:MurT ligase domain-containing protein n=1 Tax=Ihubacter sp. rT4E-8 TaxID=3242369 RepID=UPI003CFA258B